MAFSIPHCLKPALLLGLDIGQADLRMVELSQQADQRYRLERSASLQLPPGIIVDRQIQHPGRLGEHIAALAARLGSKRRRVALALPADAVLIRQIQVPARLISADIENLIATEAANDLTLSVDQVSIDHHIYDFNPAGDSHAVILAAARREQIEDRVAAVEAAGLIADVLDIDLCAAHAACMQSCGGFGPCAQTIVALLLCEAARTQISLFDCHRLLFHRELPDCNWQADIERVASAAIRALLLAIPEDKTLQHVFIGGDCPPSHSARLMRLLQDTLPADRTFPVCSVARPFPGMASSDSEAEIDDHAGAYLVACGLAMRRPPR